MTHNYLMPKYMTRFQCIGPTCEDTCCNVEWSIFLDKKTTMQYLNCPQDSVRNIAKRTININKNDKLQYGTMGSKKEGDSLCGFCNKEGLCEVHAKLGEKALSVTCYTYPKIVNIINGQRELSAQLSCPEVARLILLEEDSLEFIEDKLEFDDGKLSVSVNINTSNIFNCKEHEKIFWDLRLLIIRIISSRSYLIEDRLVYLGILHNKLQPSIQGEDYIQVQKIIASYTEQLDSGEVIDFGKIKPDVNLSLDIILKVINNILKNNTGRFKDYADITEKVMKGIGGENGITSSSYYNAKDEWSKVKHKFNLLLENYLVQQLFSTLYPINIYEQNNNLFVSYFILAFKFILIKFNIIGLNNYYKNRLEEQRIVEMIARFSKVIDHDKNYLSFMKAEFEKNNILKLSYLIMIIKN